eukprot:6294082-Karenia_brevis.AAC.1
MVELKKRISDMEATMSTGMTQAAGSSGSRDRFVPGYVELKGFCTWDARREKGLTRTQAQR